MIPIKAVVERFVKDRERDKHGTSYYLGLKSSEDFRPFANDLTDKLKLFGVLSADEREVKPFTKEVIEEFGINYNILNEEVENKLKRDFGVIVGTLTKGKGFEGMDIDEMKQAVSDPFSTMVDLKKRDPQDALMWVAKVLHREGKREASVREWFLTHFFFNKLAEAKARKLLKEGKSILGRFLGRK